MKKNPIPSVKSYSIKSHFCHESKDVQLFPKTKEKRTSFLTISDIHTHHPQSLQLFCSVLFPSIQFHLCLAQFTY